MPIEEPGHNEHYMSIRV